MNRPCSKRGELSVAFYRGTAHEPLINRVTQWWTGQFVHCELVFVDPSTGQNLACGVWQDETVFLRPKTFGRDTWSWRTISVPEKSIQTIKQFCKEQADANKPFNKAGLVRCTSPFPRPTDEQSWFCSELAVTAMLRVGLFQNIVASATTPTELYNLLGNLGSNSYQGGSVMMNQRISTKGLKFMGSVNRTGTMGERVTGASRRVKDAIARDSSRKTPPVHGALRSPWTGGFSRPLNDDPIVNAV